MEIHIHVSGEIHIHIHGDTSKVVEALNAITTKDQTITDNMKDALKGAGESK